MFGNYFIAAWRNLARTRFYSAIGILGLGLGLCVTLIVGLIVRSETTFDHFIPGYEHIYLAGAVLVPTEHPPLYNAETPSWVAGALGTRFAAIEAVSRVSLQQVRLQQGRVAANETIYWADPNVFDILRLPSIAGNLASAMQRPDSIVLTRSMARKYFGRDAPLGETLLLDGAHPMRVTAVIADLPDRGTQLESGIFASGSSSYSVLTRLDHDPQNRPDSVGVGLSVRTYLRLTPNTPVEPLQAAMPAFIRSLRPDDKMPVGVHASLQIIRIDRVHLSAALNPGVNTRLAAAMAVGLLILLIAGVNFVNLATARASRRALEVGIRKVCGAGRGALVTQFLGESLLYTLIAAGLAVMLVELFLPAVNSFWQTGATLPWWRDPALMVSIGVGALLLALLAGSYPAFLLSAFRPAAVLRGRVSGPAGNFARLVLVSAQFAILIGLIIAAGVVYEQRAYATHEALRVDADQVLIIRARCTQALEDRLRALHGVNAVVCSDEALLTGSAFSNFRLRDGSTLAIDMHAAEIGIFALYSLRPVAGSFRLRTVDGLAQQGPSGFVINETAVRRLGFPSAQAAIGQPVPVSGGSQLPAGLITAVTADFAIDAVHEALRPAIYLEVDDIARTPGIDGRVLASPTGGDPHTLINVKLTGHEIPQTLAQIDKLLLAARPGQPADRLFLNDYIQSLYLAVRRQEQALEIAAGLAVLIASLGLAGLSASMAERRTREIGIRKAMGAGTSEILQLLLWQFTRPVLWAMVIAWVVAGSLMNHWLQSFAYHVSLDPWVFLAAAALGLGIALGTAGVHCYLVARAKPVDALRYE
jgi:putative ABC transport system permease protein